LLRYSKIEWQVLDIPDEKLPKVSIIVPTLEEEHNIETCLKSLRRLDYPNFEIIVVDGGSKDHTVDIAKKYADTIIVDSTVPLGWIGKSYGCHLGYQQATGKLLLFTDADTIHSHRSLRAYVYQLLGTDSDLLSFLPFQKAKKWYEYFVGFYFFLSFLAGGPLEAINNKYDKTSYLAIGQYLLFKRSSYEKIGGHATVSQVIIEDLAFAKLCKDKGLKLHYMGSQNLVKCRMYSSGFKGFYYGFRKAIWGGFVVLPKWRILFVILWLIYAVIAPYTLIKTIIEDFPFSIGILASLAAYLLFVAVVYNHWRTKGDTKLIYYLFFPIIAVVDITIILISIYDGIRGHQYLWKNRSYAFVRPVSHNQEE